MGTITLPNFRVSGTDRARVRLKDGGVYVEWSSMDEIKAWLYSDEQKSISGRFDVKVDPQDRTRLLCVYAATKPQYLGVNRIILQCKYNGADKAYDKPLWNFVRWTADQAGEEITIDDPEVDVEIEAEDMSSSVLDEATAAALAAADKANEAAEQVPLQVLTEAREATAAANTAAAAANAAGITSVQASIADNEPGTPSVDAALLNKVLSLVFHHLKGAKGDTGATPNITVGTVTTGEPGTPVVVTMTGTAEAPVLNITIPQGAKGEQGNTGSSVDYPFELVNNLTTDDATKALSAAQGVVLDGKVSQLQQEVTDLRTDVGEKNVTVVRHDIATSSDFTNNEKAVIADSENASFGNTTSSSVFSVTDYVDVSDYAGKTLKFTLPSTIAATTVYGIVFYSGITVASAISGVTLITGVETNGYELVEVTIPDDAVYARFSFRTAALDNFEAYVEVSDGSGAYISGLGKDVQDLQDEVTEFAQIDLSGMTGSTSFIADSGYWKINGLYDTVLVPIKPGVTYKVVNIYENNTYYAPLKNNSREIDTKASFASGYSGRVLIQSGESSTFVAPADAYYLHVIRKYSDVASVNVYGIESQIYTRINDCELRISECEAAIGDNDIIVEMELERGFYDSNGDFGIENVLLDSYLRTPNFLKLPADGVWGVRTDSSATMVILRYYKDDYTFLSGVSATALEASGFTEFTAPTGAVYVKMNFRNDTTTAIIPGKAYFKGKFGEENPIYYNIRPADNGYQTLEVRVNLHNPTACDATTDAVQDNSAVGADYGVLAIPARYVNRGTPTRLIIYCHGAAVNYASSANRFDSRDLNPDYWLSEGYAVMDVEGNPFDNENEHFGIPQAYQCYKAAYEWVINHYNIRRDGVFLGGRSMGGLMTLDIITQERGIPVIAACPNVPCVIPTWYWNYMSANRRTFCASHLGFVNQPTWTGTSPMPSAEWDCLKANFDKLALASPFWRLLNNLPSEDDLFNGTNVIKSSNDPTPMLAVYGNCRMRIKTPTKLFLVRDDTVVIPEMNGDIIAKIAKQSGQIFVVRNFLTGDHHYDTQNPDLQVTITNTYGESITTSVVYIEMLAWWREWEQRSYSHN